MVPEVPKCFSHLSNIFSKKKFLLIFWPLLGHFLVQQKFLITPFLAPGQFTTENKAIFGSNQQFFRQKFDRKGVKYHQNIFGECSLGSKEHFIFWKFLTLTPPHPGSQTHGHFPIAQCARQVTYRAVLFMRDRWPIAHIYYCAIGDLSCNFVLYFQPSKF